MDTKAASNQSACQVWNCLNVYCPFLTHAAASITV
jgi:hypothetical protein